jgi:pimeloyl-ACP methyl ester carboxylesterase
MSSHPPLAAPWILLRGLTRESRHWGDFPKLLQAQSGGVDVVTLDLPGNGRLNAQASPMRVADMVAHCRTTLRLRGIVPPYQLLGMSLGAMVAIDWATDHAEELQACVLINTSARSLSPWHQRLRLQNLPRLLRVVTSSTPEDIEESILALTTQHPDVARAPLLAAWVAWRLENPVTRANALRQLIAAARFEAPHEKPAVALLMLVGAQDRLVDPRCSLRLAARWGTELRTHPTAGHDLPLDDGPWVAREVARWLAARGQAPRKCFL